MVLKNRLEDEKILRAKRRLKRLKAKADELGDKFGSFRSMLKEYKQLAYRETCPLCKQKINAKEFEDQIPKLERNIAIIDAWFTQNYTWSKKVKIEKPLRELKERQEKERKERVHHYLEKNRNKLNKAIRTFELPTDITTNDEKELWNEAMQLQLDRRGMDENDDLEFEILT